MNDPFGPVPVNLEPAATVKDDEATGVPDELKTLYTLTVAALIDAGI